LLLNYCLLVDSVSNMFHAVIGYLFCFVAICLLNFPVTELFTHLVICLLLNLLSLYLWAKFHFILRSAGLCTTLGNTVFLYGEEIWGLCRALNLEDLVLG